jgi:hypothetical protein
MVMSPPLTIEKEQIDDLIGIAHIALDATAGELGVTV